MWGGVWVIFCFKTRYCSSDTAKYSYKPYIFTDTARVNYGMANHPA